MQIPNIWKHISVNEGNLLQFKKAVRNYIYFCQSEDEVANKKVYSSRYIGSLVADFHRNLI